MPELAKTILANSSNLKAYYRFESGALTTDSSGQGHTLTNNNTVAETTGKFGGGASTGTGNTNKNFSTTDTLDINGGAISMSFWVKMNAEISTGVQDFMFQGNNTAQVGFGVDYEYNGGTRRLGFIRTQYGVGSSIAYATATLGTTDWHHIVLTNDGTTTRGYLNGKFVASVAASGNGAGTFFNGFTVFSQSTFNYASASLDDVAVFNTALSADQIKELYEGRIYGELRPNQFGTTVGLWHLNGNSTDFSGNNNHGTDTNITYSTANGKWGQGASIPSNGRIALASTLLLSGACSLGFWIKPGNYTGDGYVFTSYTESATGNGIGILFDSSEVISIGVNDNIKTIQSTTGLSQSVFTHVVFVINGSSSGIYINGSLNASGTLATLVQNTNAFRFNGRWTSGSSGDAVQGAFTLEEPFCTSTALTANQIRQIYAYQKGLLGRYA